MKKATRFAVPALLVVAGLVLVYVGASVMFAPESFYAGNGITLAADASRLSEVRAPAGLLLLAGAFAWLGAFRRAWRHTASIVTAVVYGSYGLSRLAAVLFDGMPSQSLVVAMTVELVIGALAASAGWVLTRARTRRSPAPRG